MPYPTTLDTGATLPTPNTTDKTNSPSHSALHGATNVAVIATETKIGTGASTPVANTLLFGTGVGTSAWTVLTSAQLRSTLSDETGTGSAVFATSPTLVTPAVDTINESTPANGVTIDGVLLKDNKMNGSYITDSTIANAQVASGAVVQVVDALFTEVATGSTQIPADDTIPQITEGDQYMTLAITPKSATNKLIIEGSAMVSSTGATQNLTTALFQDATANALAANRTFQNTGTAVNINPIYHSMIAGTTSSTTFRVRIGAGAAGTTTFNGTSGGRNYGAIPHSFIKITEIKA